MDDGQVISNETVDVGELLGIARVDAIFTRLAEVVGQHSPDVVVMEDYAYGASTNNITKLAELGGSSSTSCFALDIGRAARQCVAGHWPSTSRPKSAMKKFCLGNGATKKDSRYLLEVFERIHKSFTDDNQADAYMHAWMCSIVIGVIQGKVKIGDLGTHQQEALIAGGVKRTPKLSMGKAMKLSEEEKRNLAGF